MSSDDYRYNHDGPSWYDFVQKISYCTVYSYSILLSYSIIIFMHLNLLLFNIRRFEDVLLQKDNAQLHYFFHYIRQTKSLQPRYRQWGKNNTESL